jgi:hypothetical protein
MAGSLFLSKSWKKLWQEGNPTGIKSGGKDSPIVKKKNLAK